MKDRQDDVSKLRVLLSQAVPKTSGGPSKPPRNAREIYEGIRDWLIWKRLWGILILAFFPVQVAYDTGKAWVLLPSADLDYVRWLDAFAFAYPGGTLVLAMLKSMILAGAMAGVIRYALKRS